MKEIRVKLPGTKNCVLIARETGDDPFKGIEICLETNSEENTTIAVIEHKCEEDELRVVYWTEFDNMDSEPNGIIPMNYSLNNLNSK